MSVSLSRNVKVKLCLSHWEFIGCPFLILSAGYLVLEGYGGPGESSTDDDVTGKQLRASQGCAADSGINLRFSSTSQGGSLSSFSRQVLSHLRNLQTNLIYLKVIQASSLTVEMLDLSISLPGLTGRLFLLAGG